MLFPAAGTSANSLTFRSEGNPEAKVTLIFNFVGGREGQ